MYKFVLIAFFVFLPTGLCAQAIIAYYNGDGGNIGRYPISRLTHLIFGFAHLRDGRLSLDNARDSTALKRLVRLKKRYPSLKVLLAFGGWGGCMDCSARFAGADGRAVFAHSVLETTRYFHTDGIDIDWEYPCLPGYPGQAGQPGDRVHFTALMQALRDSLGPAKEISIAAGAFSTFLRTSVDWKKVMPIITRVNLMTYDFVSDGSPFTGHHTALFSDGPQTESADHAVRLLDSMGVALSKIVIGAAFYAREFVGVPDVRRGLYQPGTFSRFIPYKEVRRLLARPGGGYITCWDSVAGAPYSYSAARRSYLTYDNERSVALKASYVKKRYLGGILFWELELDKAHGGLIDVIYKELRYR